MISYKTPLRLSGVAMGLLLLVQVSMSVVPLAGSDDEPQRGVVTRTDKNGSKSDLVEIELGSDESKSKAPQDSAAESDSPATKDESSDSPMPRTKKSVKSSKSGAGSKSKDS